MDLQEDDFKKYPAGLTHSAFYLYSTIRKRNCLICRGVGHYAYECSTKKKMDKHNKMLDLGCEWGSTKAHIMIDSYAGKRKIFQRLMREKTQVLAARSIGYE